MNAISEGSVAEKVPVAERSLALRALREASVPELARFVTQTPYLTWDACIALTLRLDPRVLNRWLIQTRYPGSDLDREYRRRCGLVCEDQKMDAARLDDYVTLRSFLTLAKRLGFGLWDELISEIERISRTPSEAETTTALSAALGRIDELEEELAAARLHPNERRGLLKVLRLAIASCDVDFNDTASVRAYANSLYAEGKEVFDNSPDRHTIDKHVDMAVADIKAGHLDVKRVGRPGNPK